MDISQLQDYLCGKLVDDYHMIDKECGIVSNRQQIVSLIDNAKILISEGNISREERQILLERLSVRKSRWLKQFGGAEYHRQKYSSVDQILNERRLVLQKLLGTRANKRDRSGLRRVISSRYRVRIHRFRKALEAEHSNVNQMQTSSNFSLNSELMNTSTKVLDSCIVS